MKAEVLEPKKVNYPSIDVFEEKWKNSISGDEFVLRVHEHIDKLYAQNKP